MSGVLFTTLFMFTVISLVSFLIAYNFWESRNGILRKIMIFYFFTKGLVYAFAATALYFAERRETLFIDPQWGRIIILTPLTISMLMLLAYIIKVNRKFFDDARRN
jgi:hypothetical protein